MAAKRQRKAYIPNGTTVLLYSDLNIVRIHPVQYKKSYPLGTVCTVIGHRNFRESGMQFTDYHVQTADGEVFDMSEWDVTQSMKIREVMVQHFNSLKG